MGSRVFRLRRRQVCLASAVLALHAGLLALLLVPQPLAPPPPSAPSITWVSLAPMISSDAALAPIATPGLLPPPVSIFAPPTFTAPFAASPGDPALAGLREYLSCWLPEENSQWTEDRERCKRAIAALPATPLPPDKPTQAEIQLEQKFAHDLAVQNAPIALPCFAGLAIDVICIVTGVVNGFDFKLRSYADFEKPIARLHPLPPSPHDGSLASRGQPRR